MPFLWYIIITTTTARQRVLCKLSRNHYQGPLKDKYHRSSPLSNAPLVNSSYKLILQLKQKPNCIFARGKTKPEKEEVSSSASAVLAFFLFSRPDFEQYQVWGPTLVASLGPWKYKTGLEKFHCHHPTNAHHVNLKLRMRVSKLFKAIQRKCKLFRSSPAR